MLSDEFDHYLRQYEPDRLLFEEGNTGDCFYLIKDGLVSITRRDPEGQLLDLATLGPGEVVGEMALLEEDSDRSATARSQTKLTCWKFGEEQFNALLQESQEFRDQVLKLLSNRLRSTNEQLVEERQQRNLLYRAAGLLLYVFHEEDLYERKRTSLAFSPSIRSLRKAFDLSSDVLEAMLAYIDLDEMRTLPPDTQDVLEDAARTVLNTGFEAIGFETPFSQSSVDVDSSITFKNLEEAIDAARTLYNHLREKQAEKLLPQKDDLLQQLRMLENELESAQSDPTATDQHVAQLKAYLDGVRKELIDQSIMEVGGEE